MTKLTHLGRYSEFDEKSRNYPISTELKNKGYRSYSWYCSQHLDQGPDGACVGFSITHERIAKPVEEKNLTYNDALKHYKQAQFLDQWDGQNYEGTSVLAGMKYAKQIGAIEEYRWAFNLEDLAKAVGHQGPAVIGVNWYSSMFEVESCGYIHVGGNLSGGHAILVKGVNFKEGYFVLHNSWGSTWGNKGDGLISFEDMEKLLNEDGEACIPIARSHVLT